jgi:hypothetical protein
VWWYVPVISAVGRLRQKDHKFKASLGLEKRRKEKIEKNYRTIETFSFANGKMIEINLVLKSHYL